MNEPIKLATDRKSDADLAKAYRDEMRAALGPVCDILQRARNDGLVIGWNISPDQYGRINVPNIDVTKPL